MAFALVTVVRATRPTSAKAGDKAILTERGEWFGWVGGSCAEPTARRAAAQALADGQCRLIHLTNDETDLVRPGVELEAMTCHSGGSLEIYVEPHLSVPRLFVFGNSPIAQAVRALGELLGYGPVAVDLGASPGALAELDATPGGRRLVVVASHGSYEVDALAWALRSGAAYVGLVTSQRRLADVLERLRAQGLTPGQLEKLHAPAGLAIGATRPAEVALSILSQIVAEAQGSPSASVSPALQAPVVAPAAPAAAAPRGSGPSCCAVESAPTPQAVAAPAPGVAAPRSTEPSCCAVESAPRPEPAAARAAPRSNGRSCCGGSEPERAPKAEHTATPAPAAPSTERFSAVVLAAGLSRRMGAQNKLLLPMAGVPMIRKVVGSVLEAGFAEVVVVLGHEAEDVRRALAPLAVQSVLNPDFESGQVSSVRAGLAALTRPVGAVLVCLGDQPLLGSSDLGALCAAYESRPHGSILVPMRGNRRGNPVVMDWQSARETLERGVNFGCRHYMDENPERVFRWQAPNDHYVRDVDEPADYQAVVVQPLD